MTMNADETRAKFQRPAAELAAEIQAKVTAREKEMADRTDLTPHAQRVAASRFRNEMGARLAKLGEQEKQARQDTARAADKKRYGNNGKTDADTIRLRRDANEFASRLDNPRAASEALARAERDGDTSLAQAIAERSSEMWWFGVVNEYDAAHPEAQAANQQLAELPEETEQFQIHEIARYSLPPAMGVLSGLDDMAINRYARDEMDVA